MSICLDGITLRGSSQLISLGHVQNVSFFTFLTLCALSLALDVSQLLIALNITIELTEQ